MLTVWSELGFDLTEGQVINRVGNIAGFGHK